MNFWVCSTCSATGGTTASTCAFLRAASNALLSDVSPFPNTPRADRNLVILKRQECGDCGLPQADELAGSCRTLPLSWPFPFGHDLQRTVGDRGPRMTSSNLLALRLNTISWDP